MDKRKKAILFFIVIITLLISAQLIAQESDQTEREALFARYANKIWGSAAYLRMQLAEHVQGGIIEPHWMADGNSFWYVEGLSDNTVIYVVDPAANTKKELFNVGRLREGLASIFGHDLPGQGVPFRDFTFLDEETKVKFMVAKKEFVLDLDTYTINEVSEAPTMKKLPFRSLRGSVVSPNNSLAAIIKEGNLWIRSTSEQKEVQITDDAIEDHQWSLEHAVWSPDGKKIALLNIDSRNVQKVPMVRWLSTPEKVDWIAYPRAGSPKPVREIYIVEVSSKQKVKVNDGMEDDRWIGIVAWRPDGSELFYKVVDRRWEKAQLMAANPMDGKSRIVLDEGFPIGDPFWPYDLFLFAPDKKAFIIKSNIGGWDHFYLFDLDGKVIRQLTKGHFVFIRMVTIDEKNGWVYFTGRDDAKRPYDTHLYRVNLDGKGFKRLTEAEGQHDGPYHWTDPSQMIQFSPDNEFFIDIHSTMNRPPIAELRKADGTFLQILSETNTDVLEERLKWTPPEEFIVKAADGKTDLYGAIYKPYDLDPEKKYPIIEMIYSGEHVQRTFLPGPIGWHAQALAHQGFIVLAVDARGTEGRGVCFRNAFKGDKYFDFVDDHVAAIKQLCSERTYMDLGRVGIVGYSGGGPYALIAMLKAPDVYHVGIAGALVYVDGNSTHANIAESFLGLPAENPEVYKKLSILSQVKNLQGKLLLLCNSADHLAIFSHFMKLIDALIKAGKPYDLLVLPDENHSQHSRPGNPSYVLHSYRRYFVEHLKPYKEK